MIDYRSRVGSPHLTCHINTLRPRQNGRHFADDIFKCIFLNENAWMPIEISLKFVPEGPINNIPALVQTMAWRRPGDKPLSEPMMVSLLTHICVTRPQWVKPDLAWRPSQKDFDQISISVEIYICLIYFLTSMRSQRNYVHSNTILECAKFLCDLIRNLED